MSHTSIDDKASAAISAMLTVNKGLERLLLQCTNITDVGAQAICNALQQNATLQVGLLVGWAGDGVRAHVACALLVGWRVQLAWLAVREGGKADATVSGCCL